MKKLLLFCALSCAFGVTSGCSGYGRLSANLKDDPAIVVLNVGTPWGVQKLVRVGGQTNSVTVSPDGTVTVNAPVR